MDSAQLKRLVLKFERALEKNQELRVKHADEPMKCVAGLNESKQTFSDLEPCPNSKPSLKIHGIRSGP
jgi:hypothetical protein